MFWWASLFLALLLRVAVVAIPGNKLLAPWSGGGDAPAYVLLAQNVLQGRGFSFAGQPTALRAPAYPLLLAGLMWLFPVRYVLSIRLVQFLLGLATVFCCWRATAIAFGKRAGRASLLAALFFPTLVFITGEVLTESISAFLAAVYFYLLVRLYRKPRMALLAAMGVLTGVAALFRFNMAVLIFVDVWAAVVAKTSRSAWQRVLLVASCAAFAVSPWLIRNEVVFHGQTLYSTLGGHDAIEGVLTPQGRALPGDAEKIAAAEGWNLNDVESNGPSRLNLPSEPELNRRAWPVAFALWRSWGWRLVPVELEKCTFFWLSTDQVFSTQSFTFRQRVLRWGGVLIYWLLLALGVAGWFRARRWSPAFAKTVLFFVVLVTVLHLPYPMITRLRIPFADPLIGILAGALLSRRGADAGTQSPASSTTPQEKIQC